MKIKQIRITDYNSTDPLCRERIDNPSWDDVVSAIRSLDGEQRSAMVLEISNQQQMSIGGGPNLYICQIQPDMHRLLDPSVTDDNDNFVNLVVGQEGEFWEGECVGLKVVLEAAKHYSQSGGMAPSLKWERYA